jgi:hypothetical protein
LGFLNFNLTNLPFIPTVFPNNVLIVENKCFKERNCFKCRIAVTRAIGIKKMIVDHESRAIPYSKINRTNKYSSNLNPFLYGASRIMDDDCSNP